MIGQHIKEALSPIIFLVAVVGFLALALGLTDCTPAEEQSILRNANIAAAVKQYDDALVECQQAARQKPKELRFEAYADCEQEVSKRFCAESPELQDTWSRCKELSR